MMEEKIEIKNAVITSAEIDTERCLSVWMHLNYGGSGQEFGGYVLYMPKGAKHFNIESLAGHFIYRCIEIAGVEKWSQLAGKTIRVKASSGKVHAIGHIVNDDWFNPSEDFAQLNK